MRFSRSSLVLAVTQFLLGTSLASAQLVAPDREDIELPSSGVGYSSPAIANVDGNASNGLEIVVGGSDGKVHAVGAAGQVLWSASTPVVSCSALGATNKLFSSPSVADLSGGGTPSVVVGYGGFGDATCDGGIVALRGTDGARQWGFSSKSFSKKERFYAGLHSVFSTPAIADVDGDGKSEVAFGGFDRNVYLLNSNGKVRYYYVAADTVWSSPALVNVDTDQKLEMVIGTDISQNLQIKPVTHNGGYLLALETEPRSPIKIPFRDPTRKSLKWLRPFNQVVFSSPVVGDVLPDRVGDEVVIGSGCFFPEGISTKRGNEFRIVDLKRGRVLKKYRTPICSPSSAALGDADSDGSPDILMAVAGERQWGGDGLGRVVLWNPTRDQKVWEASLPAMFPFQSPIIADLNQDGAREVIVGSAGSIHVLSGATGEELLRLRTSTIQATPAVGDIDGDGLLDLVIGATRNGTGVVHLWRGFETASEITARDAASAVVWGQFRGGASRRGIAQ